MPTPHHLVLSRSENSAADSLELRPVLGVSERTVYRLVHVDVADGSGNIEHLLPSWKEWRSNMSLTNKALPIVFFGVLFACLPATAGEVVRTPQRRIPVNSLAAPTSQPVAGQDFYFSPAAALYFADVQPSALNGAPIIAQMLIRGGDVFSAQQLIPFCYYSDDLRTAGLVAAYSPQPTIATAKRVRGPAKLYSENYLAFGLVAGLALQGKSDAAMAIPNSRKSDSEYPELRSLVVRQQPTKENVEAYFKQFPIEKVEGYARLRLAEAAILAGQAAQAEQMLTTLRSKVRDDTDAVRDLRGRMIDAYLRAGNVAAAEALAKTIKDKTHIDPLFGREPARRGGAAAVRQLADAAKQRETKERIMGLLVYALARGGDAAAAQALCEEALAAKRDRNAWFALRLGMLAAAQNELGHKDMARAAVERAAKAIQQIPDVGVRLSASQKLIGAAILGADYYRYDFAFIDLW